MKPLSQHWKNRIAEALETQCEQNDIDFKEDLSENNARLKEHINALAHCTGGGALVFGVNTRFQKSDRNLNSEEIIARITNLAHDTQEPPIDVEVHQISTNLGKLLCLHILPPKTRPVFIKDKSPFGGQASPDTNQDIRQIGRPMVAASISPLPAWEWPVLEKDSSYGYMKLNSLAGGRKTCEQQTIFP